MLSPRSTLAQPSVSNRVQSGTGGYAIPFFLRPLVACQYAYMQRCDRSHDFEPSASAPNTSSPSYIRHAADPLLADA
jgi:hypothetical protein